MRSQFISRIRCFVCAKDSLSPSKNAGTRVEFDSARYVTICFGPRELTNGPARIRAMTGDGTENPKKRKIWLPAPRLRGSGPSDADISAIRLDEQQTTRSSRARSRNYVEGIRTQQG